MAVDILPVVAARLDWLTTTEEKRFLSYFIHFSLPNLVAFFDSPFWQKRVPQLSCADRAVYHAGVMLGALHEESIQNKMRLSGENLNNPRQRFALEQGSRAFSYLFSRNDSRDPQFRETLLLCCLLFVLADLIWARYDKALQHLKGGLKILKEIPDGQVIDTTLLETFHRLDVQSSHFGMQKPYLVSANNVMQEFRLNDTLPPSVENLHDVKQHLDKLMAIGIPFLAQCWQLSNGEITTNYGYLWQKQTSLLSAYMSLQRSIEVLRNNYDTQTNPKDLQALNLLHIQCLGQILGLEHCLMKGSAPLSAIPQYKTLLSASQHFKAEISNLPSISLTYGVIANLYVVATRCPHLLIQLEAVDSLLSWPHCEGFLNSNMAASLALSTIKKGLEQNDPSSNTHYDDKTEHELSNFLLETLRSAEHAESWSIIRSAKFWNEP